MVTNKSIASPEKDKFVEAAVDEVINESHEAGIITATHCKEDRSHYVQEIWHNTKIFQVTHKGVRASNVEVFSLCPTRVQCKVTTVPTMSAEFV